MLLLLDNNIFRALTRKSGQGDPARFFRDVQASGLAGTDSPSLALTPFSVLEAIGVVPPAARLTLPSVPVEPGLEQDAVEKICGEILNQAMAHYEQCSDLSEASLIARAREQRAYTRPDAVSFFDRCITEVIENPDARRHMLACLATDALFKFNFPRPLLPHFHVRFLAMLLSRHEVDNSVSLFRVVKRIWDALYYQMYQSQKSLDRDRLVTAQKYMKIKNDRDYLDCDLIHFLCVGLVANDQRSPVLAFTTDDLNAVVNRISVFKAIQEQFRENALKVTGRKAEEVVCHEQGVLVHCTSDSHLRDFVRVADIQAMINGAGNTIQVS